MSQNTGVGSKIMEQLLFVFFEHQIKLKMFHFQTSNYGAHKASDKYLEKFAENFDRFMEVAQGIYNKLQTQEISLKFQLNNDENIKDELKKFAEILNNDSDSFYQNNKDLLAIRDEMLADVNQLLYLLTFE